MIRSTGDDGLGGYMPLAYAVGTAGNLVWVHSHHNGAPLLTTNASGTTTPYADQAVLGFPGQFANAKLLAGAQHYYNRYRDYNPDTGRYIQADPIGLAGDANPYAYAMGNNLRFVDPMGLNPAAAIRGAVVTGEVLGEGLIIWCRANVALCMRTIGPLAIRVAKTTNSILDMVKARPNCPNWLGLANKAHPPGYWPADRGAEEWGRRNGVGKNEGRRRFHDVKRSDGASRATDGYGVNPATGDVVDPQGEWVGNIDD